MWWLDMTQLCYHNITTDGVRFEVKGASIREVEICLNIRDDIDIETSEYDIPDFGLRKGDGDVRPLGTVISHLPFFSNITP